MMKFSSTSLSTSLMLCFMFLLILSYRTDALLKLPPNVTIPALIAFGDSIMDTGNNNNIKTIVKCNFPPYGQDFEGGIPTGRFCNGKNPSDLIVEELGLKELLPAYLDPNLKPSDLPTGVCFASGASGYDPLTPKVVSVISMSAQLEMFKEYLGRLKAVVGEKKKNYIIANTLFIVVAGSDDLANTYFTIRTPQLHYDVPAYTDLMVSKASEFVKEIYNLGARRIGIFSAAPIGYLPSQRTLSGGLFRKINDEYNEAAKLFNSKLSNQMDYLYSTLPNSRVIYIDIYSPLLDIILKPQKYGYKVADKGCCGTGKLEVSILCNPLTPPCEDNTKYIFWDSYHPTESVYRVLVAEVLPKYIGRLT
ncbi:unnamed protein product [Trifolium pratense]|uniref:Uncharacterized protein n=1 Tax=Trifolium pratense TaxID=57577 RepID=A0ACB0JDW6_TRIPR|nr:unnamed protein product [Trifolium pratense]